MTPTGARTMLVLPMIMTALASAACSGDDEPSADASRSEETAEPTASVDPDKVSPEDLPEIPQVRQARGALEDVSFGDCATEEGEQVVAGEVTNSRGAATDYAVVVSWTNDTSDVLARGVAVVEGLGPGDTEEFELTAPVPEGVTQCTYFVQRGSIS